MSTSAVVSCGVAVVAWMSIVPLSAGTREGKGKEASQEHRQLSVLWDVSTDTE